MFLPWEIINEILLKVPLKSVIRFKCVCKLWYTLISDPYFAMVRGERVTPSCEERIVYFNSFTNEFQSRDCNASLYDDSAYFTLNPSFLPPKPQIVSILGSCRGFLHLTCHKVAGSFVWNPFTGIHKHIPMSPIEYDPPIMMFSTYLYGFGYDPSTNDYLFIRTSGFSLLIYVEIFSLRANAWIEIDDSILTSMSYNLDENKGSYLNGALHWMTFKRTESMNVIIVFDLIEWSFSEILLPVDFEYQIYDLTTLHENLCAMGQKGPSIEIWIMKEYKVHSSWTKMVVISLDDTPIRNFFPMCSTKSGNIVGTYLPSGSSICNDKGELIEHRSYGPFLSAVAVYKELSSIF